MSDMPKKIWITGERPPFWQVGEPPQIYLDATEYIRSDMAEQRIQELERQITEAREFLTEWASHNPQNAANFISSQMIERVLVEARQKLKPIRPFNGVDDE